MTNPIADPIVEVHDTDAMSPLVSGTRSEEHTSEPQSRLHLVCRLLLEKKNDTNSNVIVPNN